MKKERLFIGVFALLIALLALPIGAASAQSVADVKEDLDTYKDDVNQGMGILSSRIATLESKAKLSIKGDVRFRHEVQNQAVDNKNPTFKRQVNRGRMRVRARFSLDKKVNDEVFGSIGLATGGTEPTSTNQTLDLYFTPKVIALDYAYLKWTPSFLKGKVGLTGGKMKNPLTTSATVWDSDTNPEGAFGEITLNAYSRFRGGWWYLKENSGAAPANKEYGMAVYQLQRDMRLAGMDTTWVVGYLWVPYANKLAGNTTWDPIAKGGNIKNALGILPDFKVLEGLVQFKTKLAMKDFVALFHVLHNMNSFDLPTVGTAKNDNENAYVAELSFNKVALKNDLALNARWGYMPPNATYGGFTDSDSGFLNRKFLRLGLGYGLADNLELSVAGFGMKRVTYDVFTGSSRESRKTAYTTLIDVIAKI